MAAPPSYRIANSRADPGPPAPLIMSAVPMTGPRAAAMLARRLVAGNHCSEVVSETGMKAEYLVVLCTCPTAGDAEAVATALLEQRLAACVNRVHDVRSIYRWQGRVEHDDEVLLVIKTSARHYDRLERAIAAVHPHDVPEIVGLPIVAGSRAYLNWVEESVA